jgi:hypothetical protein
MSGTCGVVNVRATVVAPSGGTAGLITIPVSTAANIAFAASNVLADAGNYTVTVQAGYGTSFTTVSTSASKNYTYVNPCQTATITTFAFGSLSVVVGSSANNSANLWYDSISGSASTVRCGLLTWTFTRTVNNAPNYVDSSMRTIFNLT